ncbi:uncharacterized protein LOC143582101 [Bidens hawaiensis]|uniref:uncharacterized protein LOC143582101 n=1 Tax=Bidens hawaiensis TaxID=980011 RepID=UPI00404A043B
MFGLSNITKLLRYSLLGCFKLFFMVYFSRRDHLKNLGKAYEDLNLLKAYLQDYKSLCATIVDVMVSSILRILVHLFLYQSLSKIQESPKKPRILCLHGHGSNALLLKEHFNNWPDYVLEKMDLVFINGPFPIIDETSDIERFEWYTMEKVNTTSENFEEGITYIEDRMIELGPFDGMLGFSQVKYVHD